MNSKQILCKHVNRLLRERNITKSELAESIGMDKSNLGKMLNGQHPFDLNLLDPIADFFHIDGEELLALPKYTTTKKKGTTLLVVHTHNIITEKMIEQLFDIL